MAGPHEFVEVVDNRAAAVCRASVLQSLICSSVWAILLCIAWVIDKNPRPPLATYALLFLLSAPAFPLLLVMNQWQARRELPRRIGTDGVTLFMHTPSRALELPLAECQWARGFARDDQLIGSILQQQPTLIVRKGLLTIPVGFSAEAQDRWQEVIQIAEMPYRPFARDERVRYLVGFGAMTAIICASIVAVMSGLAANRDLAFRTVFIGVLVGGLAARHIVTVDAYDVGRQPFSFTLLFVAVYMALAGVVVVTSKAGLPWSAGVCGAAGACGYGVLRIVRMWNANAPTSDRRPQRSRSGSA